MFALRVAGKIDAGEGVAVAVQNAAEPVNVREADFRDLRLYEFAEQFPGSIRPAGVQVNVGGQTVENAPAGFGVGVDLFRGGQQLFRCADLHRPFRGRGIVRRAVGHGIGHSVGHSGGKKPAAGRKEQNNAEQEREKCKVLPDPIVHRSSPLF